MEVRLRPFGGGTSCRPGSPAAVLEITDPFPADHDPFSPEQRPLERRRSAIPAEPAGRRDHAVAGDVLRPAVTHDVADRARGARPAGEFSDIAVGEHPAGRDAADDAEDSAVKLSWSHQRHARFPQRGVAIRKRTLTPPPTCVPPASTFTVRIVAGQVHRRPRVAHEAADTDVSGEHPPEIRPTLKPVAVPVTRASRRRHRPPCRRETSV